MSTMTSEREAFEAAMRAGKHFTDRLLSRSVHWADCYSNRIMQAAWEGWQARAHIAQPAQAVDVPTVDEHGMAFVEGLGWVVQCSKAAKYAATLYRALSGEKAGPVADDRAKLLEIMEGFDTQTNVCPKCWEETDIRDFDMANDLRAYLSASPTPDKEG